MKATRGLGLALAFAAGLIATNYSVEGKKAEKGEETSADKQESYLLIDVSENTGIYVHGNDTLTFAVATGWGSGAKEKMGDSKTPRGTYRVTGKWPSSKYNKFLAISYPNEQDAKRGLEQGIITQQEYNLIVNADTNNAATPQGTYLGSAIGIHGPKKLEFAGLEFVLDTQFDWTRGCIATNAQTIDSLYKIVPVGTKVIIQD